MRHTMKRMLSLVVAAVVAVSTFVPVTQTVAYGADGTVVIADESVATQTDASLYGVVLSKNAYVYDGKAKEPTVTVTDDWGKVLTPDVDYSCTYSANVYPGTAYVNVIYKGDYTGSAKLKFKINPTTVTEITTSHTANSIKLAWKAVSGADSYQVYRQIGGVWTSVYNGASRTATVTGLKANTGYTFVIKAFAAGKALAKGTVKEYTNPAKVTGVVSGSSQSSNKNVIVSSTAYSVGIGWNVAAGVDGYMIYKYNSATSKWEKFKYATTAYQSGNKMYQEISGLKPGTGYMFKVAAYKKHSGVAYMGAASDTIKVATLHKVKYGYEECYVAYEDAKGKQISSRKYYRVELNGCSKSSGYYITAKKVDVRTGKIYSTKTIKTTKKVNYIPVPENSDTAFYFISVKPYCVYGGKTFVGAEYGDSIDYGNSKTSISELAGFRNKRYDSSYKILNSYILVIHKTRAGKLKGYSVETHRSEKRRPRVYYSTHSITKNYDYKMRYTGMVKRLYDKYSSTYYYNSSNKLVKYQKNVFSEDGETYLGYNVYNASGKIIKRVRE